MTQEIAVSLLSSRLQIDVASGTALAESLVSSFLHYCVFIDEDREVVMSQSISEPILAAASASILHSRGTLKQDIFLESLKKLGDCFRLGVASPGPRGEIVARLLLILGWDQATMTDKNLPATMKISLQTFFQALLSDSAFDTFKSEFEGLEDKRKALLNYTVFFTHFIEVTYTPSTEELLGLMQRGAAVIGKTNQIGCDLFIPIYCHEKQDDVMTAKNTSFILVSVKNWAEPSNSDYEKWLGALDPFRVGVFDEPKDVSLPFINVVMSLREKKNNKDDPGIQFLTPDWKLYLQRKGTKEDKDSGRKNTWDIEEAEKILSQNSVSFCLKGISVKTYDSKWLTPELQTVLDDLVSVRRTPFQQASVERMEHVRKLAPRRYRAGSYPGAKKAK